MGEKIILGDPDKDTVILAGQPIVLTVVDIRPDKCRIGIEAVTTIPVHREEVFEQICNERRRVNGDPHP